MSDRLDEEISMLMQFGSGNENHDPRGALIDGERTRTLQLTGDVIGEFMIDLETLKITSVDGSNDCTGTTEE